MLQQHYLINITLHYKKPTKNKNKKIPPWNKTFRPLHMKTKGQVAFFNHTAFNFHLFIPEPTQNIRKLSWHQNMRRAQGLVIQLLEHRGG